MVLAGGVVPRQKKGAFKKQVFRFGWYLPGTLGPLVNNLTLFFQKGAGLNTSTREDGDQGGG